MILGIVGLFCLAKFFIITICSAYGMLYNLKILFTSSLKFFEFIVTCCLLPSWMWDGFIMGPPSLGPAFCALSCFSHSHDQHCCSCCFSHCLYYSMVFICLIPLYVYIFFLLMSAYMRLYSGHHIVLLALVKITPVDAYMHIYCNCINLRVRVYLHVCMMIYTVIVHSGRLYARWYWLC